MTITPWTIYWITRLDNVRGVGHGLCAGGIIALVVFGGFILPMALGLTDNEEIETYARKHMGKVVSGALVALAISALIEVLVPSQKTALVMYGVPAIINSRVVEKDIPEIYDKMLKKFLEDDDAKLAKLAEERALKLLDQKLHEKSK